MEKWRREIEIETGEEVERREGRREIVDSKNTEGIIRRRERERERRMSNYWWCFGRGV